jgi:hypothetical protein
MKATVDVRSGAASAASVHGMKAARICLPDSSRLRSVRCLFCTATDAAARRIDVRSGVASGGDSGGDSCADLQTARVRLHCALRCIFGCVLACHSACDFVCVVARCRAPFHVRSRALPRAGILPRTRHAGGMSRVRRPACCALRRAAGASVPRAVRPRKDAGQDLRAQHQGAREVSLHVGLARHALLRGTVLPIGSGPHGHWRRRVLPTPFLDPLRWRSHDD